MIHCLFIIMLLLSSPALADQEAGTVVWLKGNVSVYEGRGFWGKKIKKSGIVLDVGNTIKTKRRGRAFLDFADGSKIVLQQESSLFIKKADSVNVDQGTVLFEVRKRGRKKGLTVSSSTIALGVRGTRFAVVNKEHNVSIFLHTGELTVTAIEGEFKRQRQSMEDEFEAMVRKMEDDFESTRARMKENFDEATQQMQEGNLEYVKDFPLLPGEGLSISGNEVTEIPIPKDIEDAFRLLDEF